MNLTLTRKTYGLYGVMGELRDDSGNLWCFTLEHAYSIQGAFLPKVAPGNYTCVRGTHLLEPTPRHPAPKPFQAFEIQNVPPFDGQPVTHILFHIGNYNADSNGCILLGDHIMAGCITDSEIAFNSFMEKLEGQDAFTIRIE